MEKPKLYLLLCLAALLVEAVVMVAKAPYPCALCHKALTAETRLKDFDLCTSCGEKLAGEISTRLGGPDERTRRIQKYERERRYVAPYPVEREDPAVTLVFDHGEVTVELFAKTAPRSTENFLAYVRAGKYDGSVVHRVENFVIVAGRFTGGYGNALDLIPALPPIPNEATNGLQNRLGTLALPRLDENKDSATSDFHVNLLDNKHLDHRGPGHSEFGYAVFGQVIAGFAVIEAMKDEPTFGEKLPTWASSGFETMPREPLRLLRAIEHPRVPVEAVAGVRSSTLYGR